MEIFTKEELEILKKEDQAINKLKLSEIDNDLSLEQKAIAKKMVQSTRKKFVLDTSKRSKKTNEDKQVLISELISGLGSAENIEVINEEREFTFIYNEIKYKVVLSAPRK